MVSRDKTKELLCEYVKNPALINHCEMVAKAMEAYARKLNLSEEKIEVWWTAGLLHDIDWEKYPDEHPNKAIVDILPSNEYPQEILNAIAAHAPDRTGKKPEVQIEKYLFACDELSGFMHAASLVRPTRFEGMEVKSIIKRLKEKSFAANVSRDDIWLGAELIEKPFEEHIDFLINVFSK